MDKKSRDLVMGKLYLKNKDYKMAEKSLLEYLNLSPEDFAALKMLAQTYESLNNYQKAFEFYERSYLVEPERKGTLLDICRLLLVDNSGLNHVDRRKWLKLSVQAFPTNPIVASLRDTMPVLEPISAPAESELLTKLNQLDQRLDRIEEALARLAVREPEKPVNFQIQAPQPAPLKTSDPVKPQIFSMKPATLTTPPKPVALPTPQLPKPQTLFTPQPQKPEALFTPHPQKPEALFTPQPQKPEALFTPQPQKPEALFTPQPQKPEALFTPQPQKPEALFTPQPQKPEALFAPQPQKPEALSIIQPQKHVPLPTPQPTKPTTLSAPPKPASPPPKPESPPPKPASPPPRPASPILKSEPKPSFVPLSNTFSFGAVSSGGNLFADSLKKLNLPVEGSWTFGRNIEASQPKESEKAEARENGQQDGDGDDGDVEAPEIPIENTCDMQQIEIKSGEEEEDTIFEHRCKLFRFRDKEYKERGLGNIKVLKHRSTGAGRLIMRRDLINLVCLNCWSCSKIERVRDTQVRFAAVDASDGEANMVLFLVRFKTPETTETFISHIKNLFPDQSE